MEELAIRKSVFKIINFLLLLSCQQVYTQNLVDNYSFENISQCPDNSGQIDYATGWINPTQSGTPDLYHSCSSIVDVPSYCNCYYSFQYPKTGEAYVGIWAYQSQGINTREYIQTSMTNPLTLNECYLIEFNVNLLNGSAYATNNIGVYLSQNPINLVGTNTMFGIIPQVYKKELITDTLNWVKVRGVYISDGTEGFLTIGTFFNDNNIDTLKVNNTTVSTGSYYLIDDVSVLSISDLPNNMPANGGQDAGIAVGDSIFIGQEISNLNCTWTELTGGTIATNTSGLYVKPTVTTTYIVEQNLCGTITTDTVQIFVHGVGLQEFEFESGVLVYPNPSSGSFSIETDEVLLCVCLFDELGRQLELNWIDVQNFAYSSDLATGVYRVVIQTVNGRIINQKINVQDH